MIRSIKTIMRQDREPYRVPRRVQDVIPIQCVWPDGIFKVGIKFSKTYRFTDINYKVASRNDKETMFLAYSELLNSLDCAATTKLTICNRRQSQADFEQSVLMPMQEDGLDKYRREYNQMLMERRPGPMASPRRSMSPSQSTSGILRTPAPISPGSGPT